MRSLSRLLTLKLPKNSSKCVNRLIPQKIMFSTSTMIMFPKDPKQTIINLSSKAVMHHSTDDPHIGKYLQVINCDEIFYQVSQCGKNT